MDIKDIFSSLTQNGKGMEMISSLLSTFANSNKPAPPPTEPAAPTYDPNNPYFSLPNYTNPPQEEMKKQQQNTYSDSPQSEAKQNNIDFVEILKLVMPLLNNKKEKTPDVAPMQQEEFESKILNLKRVN